jgi:hypothetical protein
VTPFGSPVLQAAITSIVRDMNTRRDFIGGPPPSWRRQVSALTPRGTKSETTD